MEQRQAVERRRVAEEAERLRAQADQTASWNEAEAQRLRQQAQQLSADAKHHDDFVLNSPIEVRLALHLPFYCRRNLLLSCMFGRCDLLKPNHGSSMTLLLLLRLGVAVTRTRVCLRSGS